MKLLSLPTFLAFSLFWLVLPLSAQTETEATSDSDEEEKVFPTEVSDPPYEIGDLVVEQGYYIDRGEDLPSINFRIVSNKIRVYWIDSDGLIAEPEVEAATVRFRGSVRGRAFNRLGLVDGGSGLGASGLVLTPHIFNVILVLGETEDGGSGTHSFRYVPSMDQITVPEIPVAEEMKDKEMSDKEMKEKGAENAEK